MQQSWGLKSWGSFVAHKQPFAVSGFDVQNPIDSFSFGIMGGQKAGLGRSKEKDNWKSYDSEHWRQPVFLSSTLSSLKCEAITKCTSIAILMNMRVLFVSGSSIAYGHPLSCMFLSFIQLRTSLCRIYLCSSLYRWCANLQQQSGVYSAADKWHGQVKNWGGLSESSGIAGNLAQSRVHCNCTLNAQYFALMEKFVPVRSN